MGKAEDLLINLLAAAIGFTVAWLRSRAQRIIERRRAKKFWRPFYEGDLKVVLAVFNDFSHIEWERSGVAGIGDVVAMNEIERRLRQISKEKYSIEFAHRMDGTEFRANMVLIGGADSNRVTRKVMDLLPLTVTYADPESNDVSFVDNLTSERLDPVTDEEGKLARDQGIVVLATNPYDQSKKILIVAGSYGFGSAAAAELVGSPEFLTHPLVKTGKNLEVFFTTDILEGAAQKARVVCVRELVPVEN
ncbi:hypothetical protein [Saccharopolyspora sp. 5N708]|uniref:hypothetical protein n=1 Tax=Saccharopolyspora sp. 5N708 TaxID=3457424 RepID=UPI003FD1A8E4